MNYFFLFCNVCLHTGITAQVPIMHFEFCKLKNIYTVYIFFVVVLPPQTCKFPRILDQRNMLSSTVKLAELSIRPSLGIFRGWRIWEGEEAFSYLSSSFFPTLSTKRSQKPRQNKTSSTRRMHESASFKQDRVLALTYFELLCSFFSWGK